MAERDASPKFDSGRPIASVATTLPATRQNDSGDALRVTAEAPGGPASKSALVRSRIDEAAFSDADRAQMVREWGTPDTLPVMEAIENGDIGFLARHLRTGSPGRAVCAAIADWMAPQVPLPRDQHWKLHLKRARRGRPCGSVARPPSTIAIEMHRAASRQPGQLKKQVVASVAQKCCISEKTVRNSHRRVYLKEAERAE